MRKKNVIAVALLTSIGIFAGCAQEKMPADSFSSRKSSVDQPDLKTTPPPDANNVVEKTPAQPSKFNSRNATGPEVNRKDHTNLAPPDTTVDPKKQEAFKNRQNKVRPIKEQ